MSVFGFVRHHLAYYRDQEGLDFLEAWTRSLQAIPRGPQIAVARERREAVKILRWARPVWEAAYRGVTPAEVLAEPEPEPDGEVEPQLELAG